MINPFKKTYTAEELSTFKFLSGVALFEELSHREMALFLPHLYLRKYAENEAVFFRGDPSNALYLVKFGKVSISLDIKDRMELLTVVSDGQAFGDNSLLSKTHRIYNSVVLSEEAYLYLIPQVNIEEIFESNPEIKAKMLYAFGQIYNKYTDNLFSSYKSSRGFINLSDSYLY